MATEAALCFLTFSPGCDACIPSAQTACCCASWQTNSFDLAQPQVANQYSSCSEANKVVVSGLTEQCPLMAGPCVLAWLSSILHSTRFAGIIRQG